MHCAGKLTRQFNKSHPVLRSALLVHEEFKFFSQEKCRISLFEVVSLLSVDSVLV
jgi:hypothetical protein